MWLLVISDVNIVSISCNKIQVIVWKYHYTVIIKNKNTTRNPSWVIDLKSFIMRWKGQCRKIFFYTINALLMAGLHMAVRLCGCAAYGCAAYRSSAYGCFS